jgi:hypothetical protein
MTDGTQRKEDDMDAIHTASRAYRFALPPTGFDVFSMAWAFEAGALWMREQAQPREGGVSE